MSAPRSTKPCTRCGRPIHPAAARCVHCGASAQKPHAGPGIRLWRSIRDAPTTPPPPRSPTTCPQCFGTVVAGTERCPHCDANLRLRRRAVPVLVAVGVVGAVVVAALAVVQLVEQSEWAGYCDAYADAADDLGVALSSAAETELGDGDAPDAGELAAIDELRGVAGEAPEDISETWQRVLRSLEVGRVPDLDDMARIDDAADEHC